MQGAIARMKLATCAPDKVTHITRPACSFFEFDRAEEMAEFGYEATRQTLNDVALLQPLRPGTRLLHER